MSSPSNAMPRRPRSAPATFKVYAARVPVDMLLARLRIEIDRVYTAVAFALLAATHD